MRNVVGILLIAAVVLVSTTVAEVQRVKFITGTSYLTVEVLRDNIIHFEMQRLQTPPSPQIPGAIYTTPLVYKTDYNGAAYFGSSSNGIETNALRIMVTMNPSAQPTFQLDIYDKTVTPQQLITVIKSLNLENDWKGFLIEKQSTISVFGLGEQFNSPGEASGDWIGLYRYPGNEYGNYLNDWNGGEVGNCQFPIMYALSPSTTDYAFFADNVYKQQWNFTGDPFRVEMWGDQLRWYLMTGASVATLRTDFMELVGHPLIPNRQMFGLWMSEFGYNNWGELDDKLSTLKQNLFPLDGFVLDLYWFGGVDNPSQMGSLTWDPVNFPNAPQKIQTLRDDYGIGIMTIEESYVDQDLDEFDEMGSRGYLARTAAGGSPTILLNRWWGEGGMVDWTNPAAGDYWHDYRRQLLIDDGVMGHWTDLGEPLDYDATSYFYGFPELEKHAFADVNNVYNVLWLQSIKRGYDRNHVDKRPFMISRSGGVGIQRYGAAMWSADIASNLTSLATHCNVQMHMSLSGIDYFGADVGGFHREQCQGNENEMYTQWFALGCAFDVPVRPHTFNTANIHETAPDRVGHIASNLANLRQRYELIPYYYSLAHRAYLYAEPLIPPLVYYYQNGDSNWWEIGHTKLIGKDMMVAIVAAHGELYRTVYFPPGTWIDYHTNEFLHSPGMEYESIPVYRDSAFKLPTYARAGAIIPKMFVDEHTLNAFGMRDNGSMKHELIVRVYADATPSSFILYEDDGESLGYQRNSVRTTKISQELHGAYATVIIDPAEGSYDGAVQVRENVVELVAENAEATQVIMGGKKLPRYTDKTAFDSARSGWYNAGYNLIIAKTDPLSVKLRKKLVFVLAPVDPKTSVYFTVFNGNTDWGEFVYIVGNIPELGNWNPDQAVQLTTIGEIGLYPTWVGVIHNLPPNTNFEWKAIIKFPTGAVRVWEPGANNVFVNSQTSGYAGRAEGDFAVEDRTEALAEDSVEIATPRDITCLVE